jgi:hypothetical protein
MPPRTCKNVGVKTTQTLGLLLALGMGAFISNASADLPKPGKYKGTLTITKTMEDRVAGGPVLTMTTVFKATARVDSSGFIRVFYSGDRDPLFGKLVDRPDPESDLLETTESFFNDLFGARKIEFYQFGGGTLAGPDAQLVDYLYQFTTRLRRVGK